MAASSNVLPALAADTDGSAEKLAVRDMRDGEDAGTEVPPHRSHDPAKNLKRTDPFQFGSRFLGESDDVFEFNAWDHVETDDAYKDYAESQLEMQRQSPVSDFDKSKCRCYFVCVVFFTHFCPRTGVFPHRVVMIL